VYFVQKVVRCLCAFRAPLPAAEGGRMAST
jgi:hypothetical protein